MNVKSSIKKALINLLGRRFEDKIVVFESDDWGMVRTSSFEAFQDLKAKGYRVDSCPYNTFDSLERKSDLTGLFDVLSQFQDRNGNNPKFTLNNVVANPDFERIRDSDFQAYFHELFLDTAKKYDHTADLLECYKEGIKADLIKPQFHGREHVNINRWLSALQNGNKALLDAFDHNMFTLPVGSGTSGRRDFLDSFGMAYPHEFETMESIISSGLNLFESIWNFRSKSFIAPCYVWHSNIEPTLSSFGVKYIQGTHVQIQPKAGLKLEIEKKYHYQGQKSGNLTYIVRNVNFEPTESGLGEASVQKALRNIDFVFKMKKPAVISTHRVNYIGRLNEDNRSKNLRYLKTLLTKIMKRHPDTIFMTSDELGDYMNKWL